MNREWLERNISPWEGASALPFLFCFEETDSTNLRCREMALQDAPEGLLILAERQTAGKGRRGRIWESPPGANIAMSLLCRPRLPLEKLPQLTLLAGTAVQRSLSLFGVRADIKWPNDLYVSGRKCCGILAEVFPGNEGFFVVLGIGINVKRAEKSPEVAALSASLEEAGFTGSREALIAAIYRELGSLLKDWERQGDLEFIRKEYEAALLWKGETVRLFDASGDGLTGRLLGIQSEGKLRLETQAGESIFHAGELSLRKTGK